MRKNPATSAKDRLLEAASLFGWHAYAEVGIAQILEEADARPPTLYHHFGDKEGLFVAWALNAAEAFEAEAASASNLAGLARAVADPGSPNVLHLLRESEKLERPESREAIVGAIHGAVFEPLYRILLSGMEAGEVEAEPLRRMAAAFLAGAAAMRDEEEWRAAAEWWSQRFWRAFARV